MWGRSCTCVKPRGVALGKQHVPTPGGAAQVGRGAGGAVWRRDVPYAPVQDSDWWRKGERCGTGRIVPRS